MVYDVIVVGGGPAGSRTAFRLSSLGHRVLVLERNTEIGMKSACTGIIGQECVAAFSIDDSVIIKRVKGARIISPSGKVLKLYRDTPQACILDRGGFDRLMAQRARDAGAEYMMNSPVRDVAVDKDGVSVWVGQGATPDFRAKALVLASGLGGGLGEKLGLGRCRDFVTGAQAEVKTVGVDEVEVYFGKTVAPGFFAWIVPLNGEEARIGLLSREKPVSYLEDFLNSLRNSGRVSGEAVSISPGAIPMRTPPKTYGERVVAVGDAAGQVKPTTGGGIYYGLLCADIAAETMHEVIGAGNLSAARLARYERRWQAKIGHELKVGCWARQIFERMRDGQMDRVFDMIAATGIDEALLKSPEFSFDWHSRAIMALVGHQLVSKTLDTVRLPFGGSREK